MDLVLAEQLAAVTATELCVGPSGEDGIQYSVANGESLLVLLGSVVNEISSWKNKHDTLAAEHQQTKGRLALATENFEARLKILEEQSPRSTTDHEDASVDRLTRLEARLKKVENDLGTAKSDKEFEERLQSIEEESSKLKGRVKNDEEDLSKIQARLNSIEEEEDKAFNSSIKRTFDEDGKSNSKSGVKGKIESHEHEKSNLSARLKTIENENSCLKSRIESLENNDNSSVVGKLGTIEDKSSLEITRLKGTEDVSNECGQVAVAESPDGDRNANIIEDLSARISALEHQPTAAVANAQIVTTTTNVEEAVPKHVEGDDVASLLEPSLSGLRQDTSQLAATVRSISEQLHRLQTAQKSRDAELLNRKASNQGAENIHARVEALDATSVHLRDELNCLRQHLDDETRPIREYISISTKTKSDELCAPSPVATEAMKRVDASDSWRNACKTTRPSPTEGKDEAQQTERQPSAVVADCSTNTGKAAAPEVKSSSVENISVVIPNAASDTSRRRVLQAEARLCLVEERLDQVSQRAADNENKWRVSENVNRCALDDIKARLVSLENAKEVVVDSGSHSVGAVGAEDQSCLKTEEASRNVIFERDLEGVTRNVDEVAKRSRELEKRVSALEKRPGGRRKTQDGSSLSIEELSPLIAQYVEARLQVSEDELRGKRTNMNTFKTLTSRLCQSMRRHRKGAVARSTEFVLASFGEVTDSAAKWLASQPREEREPVKRKLQTELRRNLFVDVKEPPKTTTDCGSGPSRMKHPVEEEEEECDESGTLATCRQMLCLSCKRPTSEQNARKSGRLLTAHRQFVGSPDTADSVVWRGGFKMKFSNSFYSPPTFNDGGQDSPSRIKGGAPSPTFS